MHYSDLGKNEKWNRVKRFKVGVAVRLQRNSRFGKPDSAAPQLRQEKEYWDLV